MIRFQGETLGYGDEPVLHDVRLVLSRGERVALLGRSGAGKSTLLAAAFTRLEAASETVSLVPQEHGLVPQLSVFHNVFMGRLDRHGAPYNLANLVWPLPRERALVRPFLAVTGLERHERQAVETLSGGQKQRTALARALFRGGSVLLADEPVSAVDESQAARLMDEIAQRFETVMVVLHDLSLARRTATRIVGLAEGRILFDRAADEIAEADLRRLYGG